MSIINFLCGKKRVFISTCAAIIFVLLFLFIDMHMAEEKSKYDYVIVNKDCSIYVNNKKLFTGDSNNFDLSQCKRGDEVTLECTLDKGQYVNPVLFFINNNNVVNAEFNGNYVYSYGAYENSSKVYGNFIVRVPIENDYQNGFLKVKLILGDRIKKFPEIRFMKAVDADKLFLTENIYVIFIAMFFFVLGIICVLFIMYAFGFNETYQRVFTLSFLTAMSALWLLTKYNIIEFWTDNKIIDYYLEYNSFYITMTIIIIYNYYIVTNNFVRKIIKIVLVVDCISILIIDILQFCNVVYLHNLTVIYVYISSILVTVSYIYTVYEYVNKKKNVNMFIIEAFSIFFAVVVYGTMYLLNKTSVSFSAGCIPIVIFVFLTVNYLSIINEITATYINKVEAKSLMVLAYKDPLTKLPNRRAYNEYVEKIANTKSECFAIFSFDLNNLKKVNDEFGHRAGDELICRFAKALSILSLSDFSARMGGDEFISFIKEPTDEIIERYIRDIKVAVDMLNDESDKPYNVEYACGYSIYNPEEDDLIKMIFSADNNMYRNKEIEKSECNI